MATVLIPIPARDFDPTETAVPWKVLTQRGHGVRFATPDGRPGRADERMLTGAGLGIWKSILMADSNGRQAYTEMIASPAFAAPQCWDDLGERAFDALLLPGGHAPGMKPYLESQVLQDLIVDTFVKRKPLGAICHGVLLVARSRGPDGQSVLLGKKTTALPKQLELTAWAMTGLWLKNYYRTYPTTVQEEVTRALARPTDFLVGPTALVRDAPDKLDVGFTLRDENYLSARWPGDAHRFAVEFGKLLDAAVGAPSFLAKQARQHAAAL